MQLLEHLMDDLKPLIADPETLFSVVQRATLFHLFERYVNPYTDYELLKKKNLTDYEEQVEWIKSFDTMEDYEDYKQARKEASRFDLSKTRKFWDDERAQRKIDAEDGILLERLKIDLEQLRDSENATD